jgi:hypothetical protein
LRPPEKVSKVRRRSDRSTWARSTFPEVRELVEELLEGGKAAFELRRLKYGFWLRQGRRQW